MGHFSKVLQHTRVILEQLLRAEPPTICTHQHVVLRGMPLLSEWHDVENDLIE
jgi:hypothetical protein